MFKSNLWCWMFRSKLTTYFGLMVTDITLTGLRLGFVSLARKSLLSYASVFELITFMMFSLVRKFFKFDLDFRCNLLTVKAGNDVLFVK